MKSAYLFPHSLRKLGWIIFLPTLLFGLYWLFVADHQEPDAFFVTVFAVFTDGVFKGDLDKTFVFTENNIFGELIGVLMIIGGILVAFTKEKEEDEMIQKLRLESLLWATYVNYAVLFLALIFIYDVGFIYAMELNMFTILLFFIARFRYRIRSIKK